MNLSESLQKTIKTLPASVTLVAVSKTRTTEEILEMYEAGQRDFGENRVQELVEKQKVLPKDIRWHQIGHLQTNKVKAIVPFIHLIQSVDSLDLMEVIEKEAGKIDRRISVLLEVKIAQEDSKFGLTFEEASDILEQKKAGGFPHLSIDGLMGMASFVEDENQVRAEFSSLYDFFVKHQKEFNQGILSMGMSDDYPLAVECGSTMVRIGTKLFGKRRLP